MEFEFSRHLREMIQKHSVGKFVPVEDAVRGEVLIEIVKSENCTFLVNSSTKIVPGDILVFNCDPLAKIFMSYLKPVTKGIVDHQSNMAHPNPFSAM